VREKFETGVYKTITEFVADMRLLLENCYRFNGPDHFISRKAQRIETLLEQKLALLSRFSFCLPDVQFLSVHQHSVAKSILFWVVYKFICAFVHVLRLLSTQYLKYYWTQSHLTLSNNTFLDKGELHENWGQKVEIRGHIGVIYLIELTWQASIIVLCGLYSCLK